jgi:hypothetical protein
VFPKPAHVKGSGSRVSNWPPFGREARRRARGAHSFSPACEMRRARAGGRRGQVTCPPHVATARRRFPAAPRVACRLLDFRPPGAARRGPGPRSNPEDSAP